MVVSSSRDNMYKRLGEICSDQASAKSKPIHGLCSKSVDGPEAVKKVDRKQSSSGATAWGEPSAFNFIAKNSDKMMNKKKFRKCKQASANLKPMRGLIALSPRAQNSGQSSSSSTWKPRMREAAETSAHSTGRSGARLTPAPKFRGDPSMKFQTLSHKESDVKGPHHVDCVLKILKRK